MYIGFLCKINVNFYIFCTILIETILKKIKLISYLQCPEQPEQLCPQDEPESCPEQPQDDSPDLRRCMPFTIIATTIIVTLTAII